MRLEAHDPRGRPNSHGRRRRDYVGSSALMAESIECVVIGAGVVGLAVARALALRGRDTSSQMPPSVPPYGEGGNSD